MVILNRAFSIIPLRRRKAGKLLKNRVGIFQPRVINPEHFIFRAFAHCSLRLRRTSWANVPKRMLVLRQHCWERFVLMSAESVLVATPAAKMSVPLLVFVRMFHSSSTV